MGWGAGMRVWGEQGTLGLRLDQELLVTSADQAASAPWEQVTRVPGRTRTALPVRDKCWCTGQLSWAWKRPTAGSLWSHRNICRAASPAPPGTTDGPQFSQSAWGVPWRHFPWASRTSPLGSLASVFLEACFCLVAKRPQ